jgi:hypothetical protein
MDDLEKPGRAHPATNAHGYDAVLGLPPASFDENVTGKARSVIP